jgi:hypothetical protein
MVLAAHEGVRTKNFIRRSNQGCNQEIRETGEEAKILIKNK